MWYMTISLLISEADVNPIDGPQDFWDTDDIGKWEPIAGWVVNSRQEGEFLVQTTYPKEWSEGRIQLDYRSMVRVG